MNVYIHKPVNYSDMQGPCSEGFHVPIGGTNSDWQKIFDILESFGLASYTDETGFVNYLKMPAAGGRNGSGQFSAGTYGAYTTAVNDYASSSTGMYHLDFRAGGSYVRPNANNQSCATALSIRPIKDVPVIPDSGWTTLYSGTGDAGIFHNSTLGLISLSSDGINWITLADKNLGATTVYNNGDTLSEANCGKFYQWGNCYGFAWSGTVTSITGKVDASAYGPGNYYYNSSFIVGDYSSWDSSYNKNLRGGVTGVGGESELKNAYIGEGPYEGNELCFTANTAGSTIRLTKTGSPTAVSLETSTDGKTWTPYTIGNTITLTNIGDKVYWRNTSTTDTGFNTSASNYYMFVMTGSIAGSGDTNYLLNKNSTTTVSNYCYYYLFSNCKALTTAPSLPATTLANCCYGYMFSGCTGLTTAPSLPATTLTYRGYYYMFNGCTSLTTVPALPATTLAGTCYGWMFNYCTNLTSLPKLPATTLADQCYRHMFEGCSKIKLSTTQTGDYQTAYRIPTTGTGTNTSGDYSLDSMFYNTGGTFKSTPTINTTYYTSNTVV